MVAVALKLRELGHEAVVSGPPDFEQWARSWGVEYAPVGPFVHATATSAAPRLPSDAERQAMIDETIATQFQAVLAASAGCDLVVGGGALAIAARSVAEHLGVPYVYAAFAPMTLPSDRLAPPAFGMLGDPASRETPDIPALWEQDRARWNASWRVPLNAQRAALGLAAVDDVREHLFTSQPWLAADPVIAPWPGSPTLTVFQTGAWTVADDRPIDAGTEAFLDAGSPPVYVGFGSVRAPRGAATVALDAARALGRRLIVSRGWAELDVPGDADCLVIDDVNHQALFPRVAAVVHHGGAGTTMAAAMAGVPQVVVPQMFDQFYYAGRVTALGVGTALAGELSRDVLADALSTATGDATVREAALVASRVERDGALRAARAMEVIYTERL